jgi:hypothetical protein
MNRAGRAASTVQRGLFAGRRRHEYHYISRWCPDDALRDLGRLLFDLAGLAEVRL